MTTAAHGRRRGGAARAIGSGTAITLVTAVLIGGASYALWGSEASFAGGTVASGELNMTMGTATWKQVTPGVVDGASGTLGATPAEFFATPGDVIEINQPVTTTLIGENLVAGFTVNFAHGAGGAADIEAGQIAVSFHVADDTGRQIAPATGQAQLGDAIEVPTLVGSDEGITSDWAVVIRVDVLGSYQWTSAAVTADPTTWSTGDVAVSLTQLREGYGYNSAGGAG